MNMSVPWMAEIVLISWRTVRKESRPPLPSELLATFVIFGSFSLISAKQPKVATTLGWGIVIATALNLFPEAVAPKGGKGAAPKVGSAQPAAKPAPQKAPTTFFNRPVSSNGGTI